MLELGSLFGDLTMNVETKKTMAEVKKDNAKALAKNKTKSDTKYSLPVKVFYGKGTETIEGTGELTEDELKVKVSDIINAPTGLIALYSKTQRAGEPTSVEAYITTYSKFQPTDFDGWTFLYDGFEIPVKGSKKDVINQIAEQYPIFEGCGIVCDKKTRICMPVITPNHLDEKVTMPFSYRWFGGELLTYTETETDETDVEDEAPFGEETDAADAPDEDDGKTLEDVLDALKEQYGVGIAALKDTDGNWVIFPCQNGMADKNAKKEVTYPTEGTVLSLMLNHIPLDPEMFGGKKEVTSKELLAWLTPLHPEYTESRSSFEFDEKAKLIIAHLTGGSKG